MVRIFWGYGTSPILSQKLPIPPSTISFDILRHNMTYSHPVISYQHALYTLMHHTCVTHLTPHTSMMYLCMYYLFAPCTMYCVYVYVYVHAMYYLCTMCMCTYFMCDRVYYAVLYCAVLCYVLCTACVYTCMYCMCCTVRPLPTACCTSHVRMYVCTTIIKRLSIKREPEHEKDLIELNHKINKYKIIFNVRLPFFS